MKVRNILILVAVLLALGGYYYFTNMPEPVVEEAPRPYVWLIEMDDISTITVSLPKENLSESFVKIDQGDQFPWFFNDEEHTPVDSNRWGAGIPLLLSGPGADRIISENTTDEQFGVYGLLEPQLTIDLTLITGREMHIDVGDNTPDGQNYYVRAPGTRDVATVDYTWFDVLERIVREPPYIAAEE
jgi:hypothetical protein